MPTTEQAEHRCTLTEAAELIFSVYRGRAVLLRGAPGIAKTSLLVAMAKEIQDSDPDYGVCYFNASNAQYPDFAGVWRSTDGLLTSTAVPLLFQPVPDMGLNGAFPILCQSDPDTLDTIKPSSLRPYNKGVVFIDEASKVQDESVMAVQSMLAYEGRTGQWGVPIQGWTRVFIANRAEDQSRDLEFPATFDNRVAIIDVYSTINDVRPYWERVGMHSTFMDFAGAYHDLIFSNAVPTVKQQFGTPRSWFMAYEECMRYCEHLGIPSTSEDHYSPATLPVFGPDQDDPDFQKAHRLFIGLIAYRCGAAIAGQFSEYVLAATDIPTYDEIVDDPENCPIPDHPGVLHTITRNLVSQFDFGDTEQVGTYISRSEFPRAMASVFCSSILTKHPISAAKHMGFQKLVGRFGAAGRMAMMHRRG